MLELAVALALLLGVYTVIYVVVCSVLMIAAEHTGSERLKRLYVTVERRMRQPGDRVATFLEGVVGVVAVVVLGFVALLPVIGVIALIEHFRN